MKIHFVKTVAPVLAAVAIAAGCVSTDKYNQTVADLEAAKVACNSKDQQIAELQKEKARLTAEIESLKAQIVTKDKQLVELKDNAKENSDLTAALSAAKQASLAKDKELAELKNALKAAEAKLVTLQGADTARGMPMVTPIPAQ